jgi:hypothetical protein
MIDRSPVLNGRAATLHPLPRPPTSRALSLGGTELNPTVRAHVSVRYTNISGTRPSQVFDNTPHFSLSRSMQHGGEKSKPAGTGRPRRLASLPRRAH